jgi:MFS family permease
MGAIVLVPVLPEISREFAGTPNLPFLVQAVLTVPSLMVVLFSPIAGILGDRFGRKRLLMLAMAAYSILGLAPLLITSIYVLVASRVMLGIFESMVLVLATTLLGDAFSGQARDRWFGYQVGAGALIAIPLLLTSGWLGQYGWRLAFLVYSLPLAMVFLVYAYAQERNPQDGADEQAAAGIAPVRFPWSHMIKVGSIGLFASVAFFVLQLQQGVAFAEIGVTSPERLGTMTAMASAGAPAGVLLFRFITHWPPMRLLTCGFLSTGCGLLGIVFAGHPAQLVMAIFVGLIGTNILLPALMSWAVRGLRFEVRARGVGVWQGIFAVGQFVSAMIFGAVVAAVGSAHLAFLTIGLVVSMAALIAFIAGERERRRE